MNEIIDQIKSLIVSNYNQFFEANGFADRDFFEGEELKNKCKSSLKIIFPEIMPCFWLQSNAHFATNANSCAHVCAVFQHCGMKVSSLAQNKSEPANKRNC
jgi:hypothetical protein